eukprot:CAMPEP_0114248220 /NCGR_PEP_ID=MMETSP0058-20121206/13454_1 /TAXON_ID=36894 /ORGANISM="Pyramimonas parkeae, CCMP726" /LENGTH=299 /DNA_ID=CAMNT_0001361607 /DNA_START=55 /DNA_END=954 /DNA_ORIENTATION=-
MPPDEHETRERIWNAFMGRKSDKLQHPHHQNHGIAISRPAPQDGCQQLLVAAATGVGFSRAIADLQNNEGTFSHSMAKCRDLMGRTAMVLASARGDLQAMHQCLEVHPYPKDAVNERDKHDVTALEYASWRGHDAVVDYLLRLGADPNTHDIFGLQPLHKAVGHGHVQVAMRLLSDGAVDPSARCGDVRAPEQYMALTRHQTALHSACAREQFGEPSAADATMVRLLLRYGTKPDIQDDHGNTALHAAALRGDMNVSRMLLRAGATHDITNFEGHKPIELLPSWCNASLVEMLQTGDTS